MSIDYLPLFIILMIAWMVPLTLSWLRITKVPSVIVEIVLGVVMGPFVLGWIEDNTYLTFLSKTGFLFLIFLSGLEMDVNKIVNSFPRGKIKMIDLASNSFLLAVFIYFGSLLLSVPYAYVVSLFMDVDVMFLTLLLPTVALSITVPILKADGELKRKFGQIMLMEGAIATVMSIILIAIYSGVLKNGFQLELLYFTFIFVAFAIIYLLGTRLVKVRTFQVLLYRLEHAASQIRMRGTVALLMFFVVIANLIGTEAVMGAFVAGVLLSLFTQKERSALLFKLDGMSYGFFIPIFFIMVGVNLDLSALTQFGESIPFILTLTVGFFITQVIPALVMVKVFGLKKALSGGILLTARLGLTIATAQIGLSLDVISTADNAGIVTAAIVTSLLSPLLYKLFETKGEHFSSIIVLGGSRASLYLSERFKMHGSSFSTFLQRTEIMPEFERRGIDYKPVKALNTDFLDQLELHTGDLVVVLTGSKSLNLELARYIQNTLDHHKMITRRVSTSHELLDPSEEDLKVVDADVLMADHIEKMVLRPDSMDMLADSFASYRIEEITISQQDINREQVKNLAFPQSGSLVILRRGSEMLIPHGNTHLMMGDVITVIGDGAALRDFRKILEEG